MAGEFSAGFQTGRQESGDNPFTVILKAGRESVARRKKETQEREKEERTLLQAITVLGAKAEFDRTLQEEKSEQEAKRGKALLSRFGIGKEGEGERETLPAGVSIKEGPITLTGGAEQKSATQLRGELTQSPTVKDFNTIRSQVKSMDALVSQAKEGALDINNAF